VPENASLANVWIVPYKGWGGTAHVSGCRNLARAKAPFQDMRGWTPYVLGETFHVGPDGDKRIVRVADCCYFDVMDAVKAARNDREASS